MGCILIDSVNIKIQFIKRFAKVTAVGVALCTCPLSFLAIGSLQENSELLLLFLPHYYFSGNLG